MSRGSLFVTNDESYRGQAYVAEALFAVVLLAGVTLVVTGPLAIDEPALSNDEREIQTSVEGDVHNVLEQSKQEGSLKSALLYWDDNEQRYVGSEDSEGKYYIHPGNSPTVFNNSLRMVERRHLNEYDTDIRLLVKVLPSKDGSEQNAAFGHQRPESHGWLQGIDVPNTMLTVDTHVTLYGDDQFELPQRAHRTEPTQSNTSLGTKKLADLEDDDEFPIPPASSYDEIDEDDIYNVVNVRVIAWER